MHARHYALRRVNPYRGLVLTVDVGDATAHSYDGVTWHLRGDDGFGWVRPTGIWVDGQGLKAGSASRNEDIVAALQARPALPFPLADRHELWLLDGESGLPLALLDTARPSTFAPSRIHAQWQPFPLTYTGFCSAALSQQDPALPPGSAHRDALARIVNQAAQPGVAAQWFHRLPDGTGEGLEGHHLQAAWRGRRLEAEAFPELLLRDVWNTRLEQSVINDYHAWVSPLLLLLPGLSDQTRDRLEAAATRRPGWMLKRHRLLPKVLNAARLNAILVSARLEESAGEALKDAMLD